MNDVIELLKETLADEPGVARPAQVIDLEEHRRRRGYPPVRATCFVRPRVTVSADDDAFEFHETRM
ncbi:hypothetical protein GJW-30_1_01049 [Variibacter gotjawalensis]|uniref:Uncharacterized protein n=1 Tax=Variibacter gotjawalensis TaxID=1333996 RepID=A0A0S3PRF2_9BRAD|nr:hypothetical protein [Variibacter gotjawalensis]NIK48829.1 hypothetical protein [Variibacter gotjawalensis]RZS50689.1 hypothetical protein EV661_3157 [Variibacter gotjawalensis]BAT58523.1 hypothetical protein GJW-30_1_01049 [Variibacter gotjawalensis]